MKINKQNKKAFPLVSTIIASLLIIGGGVAAYTILNNQNTANTQETPGVNYSAPTDEEIQEGQGAKKDAYEEAGKVPSDEETTTNTKRTVNVGVSFADIYNDNLEIRAFTNSIVEAGTCTATVTKDGDKVTKTAGAFIDASSTQCEPIYIPKSELNTGRWSVVVSFSSASAKGASEIIEVTVR